MATRQDITRILSSHIEARAGVANELVPLVYDELRRLAADYMRRESPAHSLQATALVHEAYMRLVDQEKVDWQGQTHFLAVAAQMMPRILVDHARRQLARKRRNDLHRVTLDGVLAPTDQDYDQIDIMSLGEALAALRNLNERQVRVIELRFFAGLSVKETAHELGVSTGTVKRDGRITTAWLRARLKDEGAR